MRKLLFVVVAVMFVMVSANAQRPHKGRMAHRGQNFMACVNMPKEDLNDAEKEWMNKMALEEKMAYDFYYMMFNKWNMPAFERIMNAELNHKTLMVKMLEKYGMDNPVNDQLIGQYDDKTLQDLYNDLFSRGNTSLKDAFIAAAELEELDYLDLQKALEAADNADLRVAFTNLQRGTTHHLNAMVMQLKRLYDYDYEPKHMDKETFDKLIQQPPHRMGNHPMYGPRGTNRPMNR